MAPLEGGGPVLTIASVKNQPDRTGVVFKIAGDHKKGKELVQNLYNEALDFNDTPDADDLAGMEQAEYVLDIMHEITGSIRMIIEICASLCLTSLRPISVHCDAM